MKIKNKFLIWFIIIAMLPVVVIQLFVFTRLSDQLVQGFVQDLSIDNERAYNEVNGKLDEYKSLVISLTKLPPLEEMYMEEDTDPDDSFDKGVERLGAIFAAFIESDNNIDQVTFLNLDGFEVVRANNLNGAPLISDKAELQDKSNEYYYTRGIWQERGTIFMSDFDLSIENGVVETPEKPVIKYASPVYVGENLVGLVVISIIETRLLQKLRDDTIILNQDGNYIFRDSSFVSRIGEGEGEGENYFSESGGLVNNDIRKLVDSGYFINDTFDTHVFWKRIFLDSDEKRSLLILNTETNSNILNLLGDFRRVIVVVTILGLIFAVLLSYVLSKAISNPIEKLNRIAKKIAKGEPVAFSRDLKKDESNDEISVLARSFDTMRLKLHESYSSLEEKVEEKTRDLKRALESVVVEKNENEAQRKRLQIILDNLPVGIFIVKAPSGEPDIINSVGLKLLNIKKSSAIKEDYSKDFKLIKEDGSEYPVEELPLSITLKTKKFSIKDDIFINRGDHKIAISAASVPVMSGNTMTSAIVVFQDKTKEFEIDKAKTEFVSLASHQLRTPLTSISWFTEMLLSGDAGKLTKKQVSYVKEVQAGSTRMIDLVNSLLNVSRLELGTISIELKKTDVSKMLVDVLDEIKPQSDKKKQVVKRKISKDFPEMNIDARLLRMVFQNLISNAIKYTPKKGKIEIVLKKKGRKMFLSVADNGMGIPDSQKKGMFSKLFRADNAKVSDTEGTGLGLYIVKQIIENSSGRVWFESEEGKGTTFFVELPITGMKKK